MTKWPNCVRSVLSGSLDPRHHRILQRVRPDEEVLRQRPVGEHFGVNRPALVQVQTKSRKVLQAQVAIAVERRVLQHLNEELRELESVRAVRQLASKGIAVHHAGLLPQLKEAVELLFSANLISVLFTTETFAVGINMPTKAVVFSSLTKWDGMNFRMLNSKEYFQLAGRAGRRGLDTIGYAIGLVDRKMFH